MTEFKYKLDFPIEVDDKTIEEITVRLPVLSDYKKIDNVKGDFNQALKLVECISNLSKEDTDELDGTDIKGINEFIHEQMPEPNKVEFSEDNKSATLLLVSPILLQDGSSINSIRFRRLKGKDFRAIDSIKGDISKGIEILARSGIEFKHELYGPAFAERLSMADFTSCQEVIQNFT